MTLTIGQRARPRITIPEGIITGFAVDQEKLQLDPANPVITATLEWETPEEEKGMGPVRHVRSYAVSDLEAVD